MSNSLSYEKVYNHFKEQNCELLENTYINNSTKMKYRCSCGNTSLTIYKDFKKGTRCMKCSGKEKHSYEDVYTEFKNKNCELLETEYKNNSTKMNFKCSCGNTSSISFSNFKRGDRCKDCSNKNKSKSKTYNISKIKKYFLDNNYELLSDVYNGSKVKLTVKCPENHIYEVRYNDFQQDRRCRECYLNNNKWGDDNPNWNSDRTRVSRLKYLCFDLRKINILNDDPNYNNYLTDKSIYSIDHIFPRVAFIDNSLDTVYNNTIIKKICNLRENLQIISKSENSSKSGKYNQEDFITWFENKLINI